MSLKFMLISNQFENTVKNNYQQALEAKWLYFWYLYSQEMNSYFIAGVISLLVTIICYLLLILVSNDDVLKSNSNKAMRNDFVFTLVPK